MKRFGVMLDMSRNAVMKVDEIKNFVNLIKKMGYNMIQLYTEDTYEVKDEPYFGYMRGKYSLEELKEIVSYCNSVDVEVIPCIQTLAHLNQIFRWLDYFPLNDTADILLAKEERTYQLIENMFKSMREVMTSDYIHIGMDEAHMVGLGKYFDKHGLENRFDILVNHLNKVIEIAEKYNFKPIMWSDMFFRINNNGNYRDYPKVSEYIVDIAPKNVGLVYWDYYLYDKKQYDYMFDAHQKFKNETWFAGGAWTWTGFVPGNLKSIETMLPAMKSAKEHNIENIFMTMWGDNGKECSFYSVLPSLYAIRRFYDGIEDMDVIKKEFNSLIGENFDALMDLDLPNFVNGNKEVFANISKLMLYNDPFYGVFDPCVELSVEEEYKKYTTLLSNHAKESKQFGYIFEVEAALCDLLSIKYSLGYKTRKAYDNKDKNALKELINTYQLTLEKLDVFYNKLYALWYKENKPQGFDVQDIRLGGLIQRLKNCIQRLTLYVNGTIDKIDELEEPILPRKIGSSFGEKEHPGLNYWTWIASVNVI